MRRIAWRLQANAEGDLSHQRALALAQETEMRAILEWGEQRTGGEDCQPAMTGLRSETV